MKKHSLLLSFCSVLSMFVLLHVLFSCSSSQPQAEDVSEAEASEIISEEGTDTSAEGSIESGASETKSEAKAEKMSEMESTIGGEEADPDSEASLSESTPAEETKSAGKAATEELGGITAADDDDKDKETSLSDNTLAAEPAPSVEESLGGGMEPAERIPEPAGQVPEKTKAASHKPRYVGAPVEHHAHGGGGVAKAPTIPGKAFEKNGVLLNRFYFARQGDTPKKVSLLLYGDATKTKALAQWNKEPFSAGKLIFYNSPLNATDQKMQSFYQERQVPFESYIIGPKESLGTIAKKKLGASGSWKEIAVLNGLEKFNSAESGQKIEINPKDLATAAGKLGSSSHAAVTPPTPEPRPSIAQATPAPNVGQPPPVVDTPKPPKQTAANSPSVSTELDYGNMVTQNLFWIVIGGAVGFLLLVLFAIGKRKKKASLSDDFPEDGFSAPPKLKKRK